MLYPGPIAWQAGDVCSNRGKLQVAVHKGDIQKVAEAPIFLLTY